MVGFWNQRAPRSGIVAEVVVGLRSAEVAVEAHGPKTGWPGVTMNVR